MDSEIVGRIDMSDIRVDAMSFSWAVDSVIRSDSETTSNLGASPARSFASVVDSAIRSSGSSEADYEAHSSTSPNFPSHQVNTELSLPRNFRGGGGEAPPFTSSFPTIINNPYYQTQQAHFHPLHHYSNTWFNGEASKSHHYSSSHYGVGLGSSREVSSGAASKSILELMGVKDFNISSCQKPFAAPWRQHDGNQSSEKLTSQAIKATTRSLDSFPSVYSEIEKRLKDLEFKQSGKDLRALKQILEAMQSKGLLMTKKEERASNVGNKRDYELKSSLIQHSMMEDHLWKSLK